MTGVRANWHMPTSVEVDDDDPFAAPIERVGVPIKLDGNTAQLNSEFAALVLREQGLRNAGVSCPIKDVEDTSCHACPVAGRCGELCGLGRRQETVLTLLTALEHGR